jgi:hypothetical protein
MIRKFRYSLIYAIESDCLFILAVAHQSRRAGYWIDRRTVVARNEWRPPRNELAIVVESRCGVFILEFHLVKRVQELLATNSPLTFSRALTKKPAAHDALLDFRGHS